MGNLKFDINLITKDQQIQNILLIANHLHMKSVYALLMFLFTVLPVMDSKLNAQVTNQPIPDQEHNPRKWFVSFTASAGISSIGKQMEDAMVKSGFGDTKITEWNIIIASFTTTEEYPKRTNSIVPWDMEIRHSLSAQRAVAITFSNSYHAEVNGYNYFKAGREHYLTLDTRVMLLSMDYIFTLPDSYSGFRIGPAMAIHRVTEGGSTMLAQSNTTIKPGLNLGFDLALFEKKSWFMAFSFGVTWIPPVSVGPYSKEDSYVEDGELKTYTSTFKSTKVNLSSAKIGLTMGWRL